MAEMTVEFFADAGTDSPIPELTSMVTMPIENLVPKKSSLKEGMFLIAIYGRAIGAVGWRFSLGRRQKSFMYIINPNEPLPKEPSPHKLKAN